jgi:hypothetical protein
VASLAEIFTRYGGEYLECHGAAVPLEHRRVLALLRACGTGDLGCVRWHCESCGRYHQTPRSCGNRHCPGCQSSKNVRWLTEQLEHRLEVPYFLLTFTLPATLRPFVRSHQRVSYRALFHAAAEALRKLARDPRFLGAARLGFTAILHTWGRALAYHPHLHVLVPAGGLSNDGATWKASRPDFFVPVKALSKIFRAKFRDELARAGLLNGIDPAVWTENFITDSRAVGDGESTLKYLSRYVFRVAISNARIVSCEDGRVRFRWKKSGSRRWRTMDLDALEFIRRFLQHVLPRGLQKVRHYGFLSPRSAVSLDEVRVRVAEKNASVDAPQIDSAANAARITSSTQTASPAEHSFCSRCGGRLRVIAILFHRVGFRDSR